MTNQTKTTSAPAAKQSERTSSGAADRRRTPWGFILPALVPLLLITIGPLIFLYYMSLTDFELGASLSEARWVGLDNYIRLFSGKDPQFWPAIVNTIGIAVAATAIELVLGFGIALLIDSFGERLKGILVAILMLPMVVTPVIVGLVWKLMLNSEHGVINWALGYIGLQPAWLGPELSLTSIMIVEIWQWTPFVALILMAGLASLPGEPHEAAAIDGATGWQSLIYITLPLLMPVIVLALLLRLIDVLKIFDIIFIMTGGGPGIRHRDPGHSFVPAGFLFHGLDRPCVGRSGCVGGTHYRGEHHHDRSAAANLAGALT